MRGLALLPLAVALLAAAALAIPSIQVYVQMIGAGVAKVQAPVGAAAVNFVLLVNHNGVVLDAVKLVFDKDLPAGSYVRIELLDYNGIVLTAGEAVLDADLPAGKELVVDLIPDLDVYGIAAVSAVAIVVTGPGVTV